MQLTFSFFNRHKWIGIISLFVLILAMAVITTFDPLYPNLLINVILPAAVLVVVYKRTDIFALVKVATLMIPRILIILTVLDDLSGRMLVRLTILFLALNIFEALVCNVQAKRWLNAIPALILLLGCFHLEGIWKDSTYVFVTSTSFIYFVWAYVFWNCNFVFLQYGQPLGTYHLLVQSVSLLFVLIAMVPGDWLVLRATSLLFACVLQLYFRDELQQFFNSNRLRHSFLFLQKPSAQFVINLLSAILGLLFFL